MRRPTNHHTPPRSDYTPTPTHSPISRRRVLPAPVNPPSLRPAHVILRPPLVEQPNPTTTSRCALPLSRRSIPANILLRPAASRCIRLRRDPPAPASWPPRRPPRAPATFAALALIAALRTPHLSSYPAPLRRQTVPPSLPSPLRAGAFRRRRGHHGCHLAFLPLTTTTTTDPLPPRCPHHDA
ncbi:hypothetical protein B0H14DRAFT_3473486 [Mycena olivaceomarginata]|nr:hypothetical protein B0H14DRAFT_3473486 [Mycena olivaceomarginata]